MIKLLDAFHERDLGSLADVAPYAVVPEDGYVVTKSGGLMASWSFMGPDMEAASEEELDVLSERVKDALDRLCHVPGWSVFVNLYRVPSTEYPTTGEFASRVGLLIEQERRIAYVEEGAHFESRYVLTLCYREPRSVTSNSLLTRIKRWFFHDSGIEESIFDYQRLKSRFQAGASEVIPALSTILDMRQLQCRYVRDVATGTYLVDDHLSFLYYCLTGVHAVIRAPESGNYIDHYLADVAMRADDRPIINGERHVAIVQINGLPQRSLPGMFRGLDRFAMPIRVAIRGILLDKPTALAEMRTYERNWAAAARNILHAFIGRFSNEPEQLDTAASAMQADAKALHDRIDADEARALFFNFWAVLYGSTAEEALARAAEVVNYMHELNFPAAVARVQSGYAYRGALPGQLIAGVERPIVTTRNLAHMMPLTGIWPGVEVHPCKDYPKNSPPNFYGKTTGTAPFRFCTHALDTSGHMMIVGPSGGGKSTFLSFLLAQFERYASAQAIVIDRGRSFFTLAKAMELDGVAAHYQIGDHSDIGFAPFAHIDDSENERDYATSFVEQLVRLSDDDPITVDDRRAIQEAIRLLATRPDRSLLALREVVNSHRIRTVLESYLRSPVGSLLNAKDDAMADASFLFFETETLAGFDRRWKLPVYTHIIHLALRRAMTRPTLFVIDEAWAAFDDEYMSGIILEFLKVARKRNVAVVAATQAMLDITESKRLGTAMLQECLTKVFTPNLGADQRQADLEGYRAAGLTQHEVARIATLRRANEYYYVSPVGRRPFSLDLRGVAKAFCAGTSGADLGAVDELINQYPADWPAKLLEASDLPKWAEAFRQYEVTAA